MEGTIDPALFIKLGAVEGRLGAVEQRLDRHENTVANALEKLGKQIESFTSETRSSHGALAKQIDELESKFDLQEGARVQRNRDQDDADKEKTEATNDMFTTENIRLARWMLIVTTISVFVGILAQSHFHFLSYSVH